MSRLPLHLSSPTVPFFVDTSRPPPPILNANVFSAPPPPPFGVTTAFSAPPPMHYMPPPSYLSQMVGTSSVAAYHSSVPAVSAFGSTSLRSTVSTSSSTNGVLSYNKTEKGASNSSSAHQNSQYGRSQPHQSSQHRSKSDGAGRFNHGKSSRSSGTHSDQKQQNSRGQQQQQQQQQRDSKESEQDRRRQVAEMEERRKLPASYRRQRASGKTKEAETEESSSESCESFGGFESDKDDRSDLFNDDSDDEKADLEGRMPLATLDFDGVGSDVSETEEEDNPLGTVDADANSWVQAAPAKLYYKRESGIVVKSTPKLRSLQDSFEEQVLRYSQRARAAQPRLEPPAMETFSYCCCHGHKEGGSSDSGDDDDEGHHEHSEDDTKSEGEISSGSSCEGNENTAKSCKKRKKKITAKQLGDSDEENFLSSSSKCSSDSESETENERFKLALQEMKRKQEHPARLHRELWFNENGQMNDGPLCRCSWKARQAGIAHSIYPGEKDTPKCDQDSNNLNILHHYRIVIMPLENIKAKIPTTIDYDGQTFAFEGFSILSHDPLPVKMPPCRLVRWNIEYVMTFVKEEAPELFSIRDLDLFWDYFFVELLELYDVKLQSKTDGSTCPIFHVLPRFVRSLDEGGKEIMPISNVLKYLVENYRLLFPSPATEEISPDRWDKLCEKIKGQIVSNPSKRPSVLRVDALDRVSVDHATNGDAYPVIVHFGVRPAVLTYTGNPEYQKAWKQYVKFRHLLLMKPKLTTEDRTKLSQKESNLQRLKAKASLRRDVTIEVSSQGFYRTGIYTDVVQHGLMILAAFCHIRFHWSLRYFEEERIRYQFKNRALLELAFTHPSYRANYGTNPDHARNTLSNCGIRQPEYGNKRMQQIFSRKRGINTLIDIMSRMGSKKVKQSQVTNNERLEYLGDAVIEFLSTIHLFHMFPDLQEGGLATYRSSLVQNKHLAVLSKKLGMNEFMLYAHGPDLCHEADLKHAMANAFEAVMGALFLDGGIDIADRVFGEALFAEKADPKLHEVWFNVPRHPLQEQEPNGDRHWIDQVEILQKLTDFETNTGIHFRHIRLLARAFTRKNVGYNFLTLGHNQRLEFLGDTVLQLITSEYLYKHFPEHHEGHLSLLRSSLVNNKTQAVICDDLGMTKYVVHPPAFLKTGLPELRTKDKADLVESFLGALYVDRGLQFCKVFCKVCFYPRLKYFIMSQKWNDPKSQLQQCCLTLRNPDGGEPDIPAYKVIGVEGPTNTRVYKVAVYFKGRRLATGGGHSVQEAEMAAAREALKCRGHLFPHLEKQRNFIERRFRNEMVCAKKRRISPDEDSTLD